MSEINNDSVEAAVEKIEEPTPAVEEKPEVVEAPAVEKVAEAPVETPVAEDKPKPKKAEKVSKPVVADEEKVALFSEGNVNWSGVGRVKAGYNLVSKSEADKWLGAPSLKVRLATPEEIASKVAK